MRPILMTTLAAAALAGLSGLAQAQVPTAQSMGMGYTPRPMVEGNVASTTRQGAVTPNEYAGRGPGRVYYGNAQPRFEGRVASTPRMNAITPDDRTGGRRAWTGRSMAVPADDLRTGTIVAGASGSSRQWKWQQCAKIYPSFDPRTGTFMGQDGLVHLCQ